MQRNGKAKPVKNKSRFLTKGNTSMVLDKLLKLKNYSIAQLTNEIHENCFSSKLLHSTIHTDMLLRGLPNNKLRAKRAQFWTHRDQTCDRLQRKLECGCFLSVLSCMKFAFAFAFK